MRMGDRLNSHKLQVQCVGAMSAISSILINCCPRWGQEERLATSSILTRYDEFNSQFLSGALTSSILTSCSYEFKSPISYGYKVNFHEP